MGGTLGVESTEGLGSTFWVSVPFGHAAGGRTVPPPTDDALSGLRVLVVDDNDTDRLILGDQLQAWGSDVDTVDGAVAALRMLHEAVTAGRPDRLVVTDHCMPDVDGLELARRVTTAPSLRGVPMALLTSALTVDERGARSAGIGVRMTKPVRLSQLRGLLHDLVTDPGASPPGWTTT